MPRLSAIAGYLLLAASTTLAGAESAIQTVEPPVVPPSGSNANQVSEDDYPFMARFLRQQGRTVVRALVRADGTVGEAVVAESSGYTSLDARAVEIVKSRFRYRPASRNGVPVEALIHQVIVWDLYDAGGKLNLFGGDYFVQRSDPLPPGYWRPDPVNRVSVIDYPGSRVRLPARVVLRVLVRENGSVGRVKIRASSGSPELDHAAGIMVAKRFRYPPPRSAGGQPTEMWIDETVTYSARERPYPLPLPPVCHDDPHTGSPTASGFENAKGAQQFLINEDGSVGQSLAWDGRWGGSSLARDINAEYRFFAPQRNGVPAKCWFDMNMPQP
jgi:TonB family protein